MRGEGGGGGGGGGGGVQNAVLSFTGHSGQCDMTTSELPSKHPLERSQGDEVIFTLCGGGKHMTKTTQTFMHLKPQNLSYLKIVLVVVLVFVCLCACVHVLECVGVLVSVCACLCV